MLLNLLNATAYWFSEDQPISWIKDGWTTWIWWVLIALATLFFLIIIVLFFKSLSRTRQREEVRRIRAQEKKAQKAELKAAKAAKADAHHEEKVVAVAAESQPQPQPQPVVQEKQEVKRTLVGICVDTGIVKRHFEVGDEFVCDGLVVKAYYNLAPITDSVVGYAIVDDIEYGRLSDSEKNAGAYILRPSLVDVGTKFVVVRYRDCATVYTIAVKPSENGQIVKTVEVPVETVVEKVVEVPVETVVEKVVEVPVETVVEKVVEIPVEKVVEVPVETVVEKVVEVPVERIVEKVVEVPVERVVEKVVEVPVEKVVERVVEVPVEKVVEKVVEVPVERIVEKVVETPAPQPEPVVVEKVIEKVVEQPKVVETVLIGEETYEAGRLRYDKSFEAKFIQSDDDTKHWYTEIKNTLLSFRTCKGRISWKRETFKANKEVVAKLVFRGNTLCLFLPLNVADYSDNKEVEDASNLPVYEDTPVMIRIKNEKRKRIAISLVEKVMTDRGILRGAHKDEDFYLPYEGVIELINRGLIKREIKTVEDEAIFERDKEE